MRVVGDLLNDLMMLCRGVFIDPQGIFHRPDISRSTVHRAGRCHLGGSSENQGNS